MHQAETGGKLRHFMHECQQNWPRLSWDSEQPRDWRKKSSLPVVVVGGLLLIIQRGNTLSERTLSQLQNSFWEWEKAVKMHYLTTRVTSGTSDSGLLWTRTMVLQKYVSTDFEFCTSPGFAHRDWWKAGIYFLNLGTICTYWFALWPDWKVILFLLLS